MQPHRRSASPKEWLADVGAFILCRAARGTARGRAVAPARLHRVGLHCLHSRLEPACKFPGQPWTAHPRDLKSESMFEKAAHSSRGIQSPGQEGPLASWPGLMGLSARGGHLFTGPCRSPCSANACTARRIHGTASGFTAGFHSTPHLAGAASDKNTQPAETASPPWPS